VTSTEQVVLSQNHEVEGHISSEEPAKVLNEDHHVDPALAVLPDSTQDVVELVEHPKTDDSDTIPESNDVGLTHIGQGYEGGSESYDSGPKDLGDNGPKQLSDNEPKDLGVGGEGYEGVESNGHAVHSDKEATLNYNDVHGKQDELDNAGTFDPTKEWEEPLGLPMPAPTNPDTDEAESRTDQSQAEDRTDQSQAESKTDQSQAQAETAAAASTNNNKAETHAKPVADQSVTERSTTAAPTSTKDLKSTKVATKVGTITKNTTTGSTTEKSSETKSVKLPAVASVVKKGRLSLMPGEYPLPTKFGSVPSLSTAQRQSTSVVTKKFGTTSVASVRNLPAAPFYVDVAYIPSHGKATDVEFFRRVRAHHYVLNGALADVTVIGRLIEAKRAWGGVTVDEVVTVLPTHDSTALLEWVGKNIAELKGAKVVVAPAVSRCCVMFPDGDSSAFYRMEF